MIIAVGRIRRNEDLIGLRVFDTNTKQTKDIRIEDIDKVKIKNIKHLSELGIVDNKQEDKPIVILGEKDGKYLTVDINGKARVLNSLKGYIYSDLLSNIDSYKRHIKNNQEEKVFEFEVDEDTDEVLIKKYIPNNEKFRVIEIPSFVTGIVVDDSDYGWDSDKGIASAPFYGVVQSLKIINKNNKIKSMGYMFAGFDGEILDLSEFDTTGVTEMNDMFHDCSKLTNLDLRKFNTSQVTDMRLMFTHCLLLKSLNLTSFNTSKVWSMEFMFTGCNSLVKLDLSSFRTENVEDMTSMFENCKSLSVLDLSNFDTSKVKTMVGMFAGCIKLVKLNVSSFDTYNVCDINGMFNNCRSLNVLDLSNFDISNIQDMNNIFDSTTLTKENTHLGCDNISKYKEYIKNQKEKVFEFEIKEDTDEVLLKKYIPNNEEFRVIEIPDFITGIVVQDFGEMVGPFHGVTQSLKVINRNNKIKKMDYMFEGFSGKELDLSEFYTEEVFSMVGMFYGCNNIRKLDLSSFDTSKVNYMDWLFANSSFDSINLNSFNTSNVRNMDFMFMNCERLYALDLSSFNTENLGSMGSMFEGCRNLRALDLSNFNISKKTSTIDIFKGTSLTPENTGLK